ncbi:hypothetical protein JCM19275_3460 [Nonlabens ulvanivorans]|uniref:Uncharacterized protein n=1 Tax=Nonlabens ulvanivorans TaxID=906888 RepID=A0A090WC72_NONUL|nr:hypothetical protein [Nonlabens ulvanivorans]GAL74605.1 hypothetical protein JCM19275_3460 [Nonlabens ulvanivorans]
MEISKTGWWMIGGAGLGVIGIGVFVTLSRKRTKQQSLQSTTTAYIGTGVQVITGNVGSTKQEPNWNSPFDMNYLTDVQKWVAPKSIQVLDEASAKKLAKIIKDAKGTFNDNEEAIKDVFGKKLRDKTQIASLSKAYYQLYKKDMWQHLNSFLSQSEMKEYVSKYVQRLPNYQS